MKRGKRQGESSSRRPEVRDAPRLRRRLPLTRPSAFALSAIAVLVIAAALRLAGLGAASLWYDEALTLDIAAGPLADLAADVRAREQVPPLYHVLMHGWIDRFGDSEFAARLPSALFGVAAVAAIIALGCALFGRREGTAAGALMALSGFQVYYAQEARPYALLALASLLSCLAFVRMKRAGGWTGRASYVGATALLLWTHLFGIFVIAAQHLAWLWARAAERRAPPRSDEAEMDAGPGSVQLPGWLGLNAVTLLLFAAWIPTVFLWFRQVSANFWIPPIGPERVISAYTAYAGSVPLLVLLLVIAFWGAVRTPQRWKIVLLAGVFILPVFLPVAVSMIKRTLFVPRYGIKAATGLYLLAARGWTALPGRACRGIAAAAVLALADIDLQGAGRRLDPKPDWRAATAYVVEHDRPDDAILLNADFNNLVFQHYAARRAAEVNASYLIDGRVGGGDNPASLELPAAGNLWVVTQPAAYHNYRVRSTQEIERLGLELAETHVFDDITVQRFMPKRR
ncbi:MAG: glycosyl transferase family 39 [Phycisphaerales bacterium]|nr:glycosyl transferase family 39 [Phycisphaerales bacterium]